MFQPAKTKFRKWHRRRGMRFGVATRGNELSFGSFGLKATTNGQITSRQLEAARKALTHCLKRGGKIWIRIFPQVPITRKAAEVPMGSGKGNVEWYAADIKKGAMIMEMDGVTEVLAREALTLAAAKLPVRTRISLAH